MKRLVIVSLLYLSVVGVAIHANFSRKESIIPEEIALQMQPILHQTKQLKVPFYWRCFNPAAVSDNSGYFIVIRCDRRGIRDLGRRSFSKWFPSLFPTKRSHLFTTTLNGEFDVQEPYEELMPGYGEDQKIISPQDPRLIRCNEDIYIIFNDLTDEINNIRIMFIAKVEKERERYVMTQLRPLSYAKAGDHGDPSFYTPNTEKNWTLLVVDNEIYLAYMLDPLTIIKPNLETGICEEIESRSCPEWTISPRGGSPFIPFGEGLCSLYHTVAYSENGRQSYFFSPVMISNEVPFRTLGFSEKYIRGEGLYEGNRKIEYPSGIVDRGEKIVLFWGSEDQRVMCGWIEKGALQAMMDGE